MKCAACSRAIDTTFLGKILGTYIKDKNGKINSICFECQKKFGSKEEILKVVK